MYLFEFINWFESSQYTSEKLNVNFAAVLKTENIINPPYLTNLSNSYTMGCPHVRGDNPRALASGLSYVQVDKQAYISVDLARHEIYHAKVDKGGIIFVVCDFLPKSNELEKNFLGAIITL